MRLENTPLAAARLKEIWGFQSTTSLIGSNSVSVAKNVKNPGRLPSRTCGVQTHEGEAAGSPGLSRPGPEECV